MTERSWESPFDQGGVLRRFRQRLLEIGGQTLGRMGIRLQARVNIDPASSWHDARFVDRFGADELVRLHGIGWPDAWDTVRRDMLILLAAAIERRGIEGAIAEVGVRHGMTARVLLSTLPDRSFVLIDTMTGFTDTDLEVEAQQSLQLVRRRYAPERRKIERFLDSVANRPNVQVIQSDVSDLAGRALVEQRYAMVHIDVDLYRPTRAALDYFATRMAPGGFIAVHDYNAWSGARLATDELIGAGLTNAAVPMPDKSGTIVLAF